ncbi:MAG: sulfatase family protein [Puniceicoccales bacterium]
MKSKQPHFVFILCDQLRADFLSAYGCDAIETPNLDWLSGQSVVYENAVSTCPLCVPARAAMLTGMTPLESGVISNEHWLRPDRAAMGFRTWPEWLSDAGYHTAAVGKMHFHPFESPEGFAQRIIAEDKRWPLIQDDYAAFLKEKGLGPDKFNAIHLPEYQEQMGAVHFPHGAENTADRFVGEAASRLIRGHDEEIPLALMVGFPGPHCPYDPVPETLERVRPERLPKIVERTDTNSPEAEKMHQFFLAGYRGAWHQLDYAEFPLEAKKKIRHHYAALISTIDEEVGRILTALRERGILNETVLIFTSDHGDHVGDQDRVGKGTFYEPSIHIPLMIRWPQAENRGRRIAAPVPLQSVPATILQQVRGDLPHGWSYRVLPQEEPTGEGDPVFGYIQAGCMIRTRRWKLCRYNSGVRELFDMEADPREEANLYRREDLREIRLDLENRLFDWVVQNANAGHEPERIFARESLSISRDFGTRGWERVYPHPEAAANLDR